MTPECSVCAHLLPALRSLQRTERKYLEVTVFSLTADERKNREYIATHKLGDLPFAASQEVAEAYNIKMPPYAVLVGS